MDNKEKITNEIFNAREMVKMLLSQIEKLEERVYNGAISIEDGIKFAQSWENAIQSHYLEIDILTKKLLD